jgi:hypothetical protein
MTSEVYQEASSQKTPAHRKKKTTLPLRRFEPSVPVSRISIVGLMSFGQRWQWCSRSIGCLVRAVGSSVLPSWARPRPSRCRRSSYALYTFLGRDPIRSMKLLKLGTCVSCENQKLSVYLTYQRRLVQWDANSRLERWYSIGCVRHRAPSDQRISRLVRVVSFSLLPVRQSCLLSWHPCSRCRPSRRGFHCTHIARLCCQVVRSGI